MRDMSPTPLCCKRSKTLFPAELALAELRAAVLEASANIYKAMGGGWIDEADKLSGSAPPVTAEPSSRTSTLF